MGMNPLASEMMPCLANASLVCKKKYYCCFGRIHVKTAASILTWIFLILGMISACLAPFGFILPRVPAMLLCSIVVIVHLLGYITASIIAIAGIRKAKKIYLIPLIIFDILDIFLTAMTTAIFSAVADEWANKHSKAAPGIKDTYLVEHRLMVTIGLLLSMLLQMWKVVNLVNCYTYLKDVSKKSNSGGYASRSQLPTRRISVIEDVF